MGMSARAYLYYGVDIHDSHGEDPRFEALEELLFKKLELDECDSFSELIDDYMEKFHPDSKLIIGSHGGGDADIHFIACKKMFAWVGQPTNVDPRSLAIEPESEAALLAILKELGFGDTRPTWRLASYYG